MNAQIATHTPGRSYGLIYKRVWLYRLTMKLLYGAEYKEKYRAVAEEIPPETVVVDLCCGDCAIAPLLSEKKCTYIGLDVNLRFVRWAQKRGIDARQWDAIGGEIPPADVVCIQSSLYQFIPSDADLIRRMYESARLKVVISEPIHNVASSSSTLVRKLTTWLTRAEGRTFARRHSQESLERLLEPYRAGKVTVKSLGREAVVSIFKGTA